MNEQHLIRFSYIDHDGITREFRTVDVGDLNHIQREILIDEIKNDMKPIQYMVDRIRELEANVELLRKMVKEAYTE